jgi:hypothetical protein
MRRISDHAHHFGRSDHPTPTCGGQRADPGENLEPGERTKRGGLTCAIREPLVTPMSRPTRVMTPSYSSMLPRELRKLQAIAFREATITPMLPDKLQTRAPACTYCARAGAPSTRALERMTPKATVRTDMQLVSWSGVVTNTIGVR